MSSYVAGTATLILGANHEKMTKAFGEANKQIDGMASSVAGLAGRFASLAAPIAAIGGAITIAWNEAKRLDDLADQTGLTAGQMMQLEEAAIGAGVGIEGMGDAIAKMNVKVGKAMAGDSGAVEAFKELGISVEKLAGMDVAQRFQAIGSAIGGIADRSSAAAAAAEIFGKSSSKMLDMFQEIRSSNPFADMGRAEQFDDAVANINRLQDHVAGFWQSVKNMATQRAGNIVAIFDSATWSMETRIKQTTASLQKAEKEAKEFADNDPLVQASRERTKKIKEEQDNRVALESQKWRDFVKSEKEYKDFMEREATELDAFRMSLMTDEERATAEHYKKLTELQRIHLGMGQNHEKEWRDGVLLLEQQYQDRLAVIRQAENERSAADYQAYIDRRTQENMDAYDVELKRSDEVAADYQRYIESQDEAQRYAMEQEERAKQAKKQAHSEEMAQLHGRAEMLGAYGQALGNITQIAAEGANKSRAQFYTHKALMLAQAIVNTWTAYTAALTIPPPAGQILAGTIVAGGMYAASQIAGTQPAGRANGGAVSGGNAYEVGERGPELLSMNGRNYIIPGRDGYVNSGSPGSSGGGKVNVTIINNGQPVSASVQRDETPDGTNIEVILYAVAADILSGTGPVPGAIERTYGANRRHGARG